MATKLDYLKKYLAAPGASGAKHSLDAKPVTMQSDAARSKEKKKRKKDKSVLSMDSVKIRDLSEVLPSARAEAAPVYLGKKAKLLSLDLDEDEERAAINGELDLVDEEAVLQASKIDCERSGVAWKISNHKRQPHKQALRVKAEVKAEVVKEEKGASDDDMSPPRAAPVSSRAKASSPPRAAERKGGDSDLSPPRNAAAGSDDDLSPPRGEAKAKAGGDLSPPRRPAAAKTMIRKPAGGCDDDLSPPRGAPPAARKRHDSDSDLSPPRQAAPADKKADADLSPPRGRPAASKQRHDSDADLSPPRNAASASSAAKPRQRHDSDSDLSPPRPDKSAKEVKQDPKADLSPPRRARHDSDADLSPPRKESTGSGAPKRQRHDSDSDLSPPRAAAAGKSGRHDSDADLSPPRDAEASKRRRHDSDASDLSPPRNASRKDRGEVDENGEERMSSGLRSGLVKGSDLKQEADKVREERKAKLLAQSDAETGRGAATVYRNRSTGAKIGREEWVENQSKKRKKKLSDYPEQELAWGGGMKQQANREEQQAESLRIAAQPFARYEPDAAATAELQEKQSWHDPMSKMKDDDGGPATSSSSAAPNKPKCPHPPWPNRFNILPGYRWDGAVRGSGYEKRWIDAQNNREFMKNEKYKWECLED